MRMLFFFFVQTNIISYTMLKSIKFQFVTIEFIYWSRDANLVTATLLQHALLVGRRGLIRNEKPIYSYWL